MKGREDESALALDARDRTEGKEEKAHLFRTVVRSPFGLVLEETESLDGVSFVEGEAVVDLREEDATRRGEEEGRRRCLGRWSRQGGRESKRKI